MTDGGADEGRWNSDKMVVVMVVVVVVVVAAKVIRRLTRAGKEKPHERRTLTASVLMNDALQLNFTDSWNAQSQTPPLTATSAFHAGTAILL
ncbi:hypothetical protein E2C01_078782 [Portunus trituberculatus]|uniref:Uncharacterized protein n=1 Tax=Portunus trituberculatus TaxID=210409 RepID=A0A5B7IR22_PORTR|nr:hypothetical protein [Portunus trituberculatus]